LFAKFDVPVAGYVVNRVLPAELAHQQVPPYLRNRLAVQGRYLEEIKKRFAGQLVGHVPELERDVTGLPMIEKLAAIMYGDGGR
jgi:arsenite-transporting ATPase